MVIAFQIISGLILLFLGGEILVRGAVSMAKNLGLSTFVIGLTVVAYGTSSPELVISTQAALAGHADIALGNIIGSNISNILCVMGFTALIFPIAVDKKVSGFDGWFMLGVTALLYAMCFRGVIDYITGIVFLTILVVYTYSIFKKARSENDELPEEQTKEVEENLKVKLSTPQAVMACVAGMALLMFGGNTMIEGAISLATLMGVSEAVIGVTIVAFGSSAPELATSIIAATHKKSDIVFGNIIGSNLFNIMGVLGVTSLVAPVNVSDAFLMKDIPIMAVTTAALCGIMFFLPAISRKIGLVFALGYVAYIASQFV